MNGAEDDDAVTMYESVFRARHAKNVSDFFERMLKESNIDEKANHALMKKLERLRSRQDDVSCRHRVLSFFSGLLIFIVIAGFAAAGVTLWLVYEKNPAADLRILLGGAAAGVVGIAFRCAFVSPEIRALREKAESIEESIRQTTAEAWNQVEPLNRLFDWNQPTDLVSKTFPLISFDPYVTGRRIEELETSYGMSEEVDGSVLFTKSGDINGNPFVMVDVRTVEAENKTYTGSLVIRWSERVRGANGKYFTTVRTQVLTASVTKPMPVFPEKRIVVYGNDAAPELKFSRSPTGLAGETGGSFKALKKRSALRKLEKFSRNLNDDSNYTIMANKEFEVLFNASDRSDEVQFRMLFTPLSQIHMVRLLNDTRAGYGDDFSFVKRGKINIITPEHLRSSPFSTDPSQFMGIDVRRMRMIFNEFNNEYFRSVYFAFAPLLSIPLYRQIKSRRTIYGSILDLQPSSWEQESIANYHFNDCFGNAGFDTKCILKTRFESIGKESGPAKVLVDALGYRIFKKTEYVPVLGGDMKLHNVPVVWDDYRVMKKSAKIEIMPSADAARRVRDYDEAAYMKRLSQWLEKSSEKRRSAVNRMNIISVPFQSSRRA